MTSERAGIVDGAAFRKALKEPEGGEFPIIPALRTLLVEEWLSHLESWNRCSFSTHQAMGSRTSLLFENRDIHTISSAGENPTGRR